jgi:vacuolar-type H+-ATPase subunit F/Vma7
MKTPEEWAKEINILNVVTSDPTDVIIFRQRIADVIRKAIEEAVESERKSPLFDINKLEYMAEEVAGFIRNKDWNKTP